MNYRHKKIFINKLFRVNCQSLQNSKFTRGLEFRWDFAKQLLIESSLLTTFNYYPFISFHERIFKPPVFTKNPRFFKHEKSASRS